MRPAISTLTRTLSGVLSAFRPVLSSREVALSLAAAIVAEHRARPFDDGAAEFFSMIFEAEEESASEMSAAP